MPKEFVRRCSHCGHNGHNSRTCVKAGCINTGGGSFKLFGVQINVDADGDGGGIKKSKSVGSLHTAASCKRESNINGIDQSLGYVSDNGIIHRRSRTHERKRGTPWSEDEHRSFLAGLEKLGKGDWKGIAKSYVPTRNSSQVASHAQKYFIRKAAADKKRRRGSVFDIPAPPQLTHTLESIPGVSFNQAIENSQAVHSPSPVSTSLRPPLSSKSRRGIDDFPNMALMPRFPSSSQAFPTETAMPTVSWVPVVHFPNQSTGFLPGIRGKLATCPTYMPQPSFLTFQQSIQNGSSQAGPAVPTPITEGLNLNIRNLAV